ncbi:hypothetical protein lerEdw1_008734 [Lerista edwardsae]|nr:hypothetical protein lerEdw1_008734 [Lerista edwardsae]
MAAYVDREPEVKIWQREKTEVFHYQDVAKNLDKNPEIALMMIPAKRNCHSCRVTAVLTLSCVPASSTPRVDFSNLRFLFTYPSLMYLQASGDVGIVESIQLKNFMCHSMLGPFKFGSNVNFIVGNNGSGKSAVLTALIVGLGGKATVTNRGSSLKVFVKDGQNSADVSITLRNRGEDAFKPELYGDSITVNQHISLEGHRSYKLKSITGAVVSSKKEELTAILDHFNVQVDNPVSVLTQEMSKQFLQSKNEGDKYKFFMKATQLEQMKEDYSYIMETKARTRDQIEQGGEFLEELKKSYLEKEERYKNIAAVSEMQNKLKELHSQIAWAMVRETEMEVKPIREKISVQEASTEKFVKKVREWQVCVRRLP